MKVSYKTYNLPFKYPFTISKGTKTHQPTLIVELEHFGFKGYGEAPAIAYYNIPVEKMVEDLERKKQFVEKFAFSDPERYWHYLHHLFPNNSFFDAKKQRCGEERRIYFSSSSDSIRSRYASTNFFFSLLWRCTSNAV